MSRLAFRLVVTFVALTIGLAATYYYYILSQQSPKVSSIEDDRIAQKNASEKKRTYEAREHALTDYEGYRTCVTALESSDGMMFYSATIPCDSPGRASRELEKKLRQAVEIIKREPLFDDAGRKVGQKVVATLPPYKGSSTDSAEILWTRGSDFGYVNSSSLRNILEYEKDNKL